MITKIYGLVKNQISISTIEKVMIILLILWRPFCIFLSKRIILEWQLYNGPHIIMGLYSCTIKRKTNFYQPKQDKPHDCRTTLIFQTKIQKNTLCPELSWDLRQRDIFLTQDISGPALKGLNGCKMCSSWLINKIMSTICPVPATTGKIKITSTHSLSGDNNTKEQNVSISR